MCNNDMIYAYYKIVFETIYTVHFIKHVVCKVKIYCNKKRYHCVLT